MFVDGDPPRTVVLVESGVLKVVGVRRDGTPVVLAVYGAGDMYLGPLTTGAPAASHLVAAVPSDVVTVTATRLRELVRRTPGLALPLLDGVAQRIHEAERRATEITRLPTAARVARTLALLAERVPADRRDGAVVLPISQFDLADLAGVSREAAAKALRRLRENGQIRTARYRIRLLHL